ncbi:30S ribosomal protein S16 [Buchnera aphidicola (Cinara piceae)]|uniref:Small ribosomal subunit protein bS16 n=1 Tax=Buchnera aphidicola (Cinara piceae) TaxID=1660043 RepID=A0A803FU39_9GAMM|nr:30S ribosomal protein S16 [Buchnera aphidicola]VFP88487.1 30S ribosomal protein S16 [Buchnera aphidicola (Cinara piceae)]
MIKIRLARYGVKKRPFYKIIVADVRSARNGKFIEHIGYFNPFAKKNEKKIYFSIEKTTYWLKKGAQKTNRIKKLLNQYNKKNYSN